ncbi:MAG: Xylose isomerase domain protein barrel [Pedosphaera sp.]|nr:Xylose isomerase domain protein barrel [Pedosphaera sp.]
MLIGTMNHPAREVVAEIDWMAGMGFEFVDLTLEPPRAAVWNLDVKAIRAALEKYNLPVVGHTAYYLPLCSPFESVRRAAVEELKSCLSVFSQLGAKWMNLHPDHNAPLHSRDFVIERNVQSLRDLAPVARDCGVGLMVENLPGRFNTVRQLAPILDAMPEVGLHLDVGHCNLMVEPNSADELIAAYGSRLRHVHLHDNKGGKKDLHLPLGTGTVDVPHYVRSLKNSGYDGTITLEVFTPDSHHLLSSRDVLRRIWGATPSKLEVHPHT